MVTVENNVGRLIEVRQTGRVTIKELEESFPLFQRILTSREGRFVLATDWRGMRLMQQETADFLLNIMRAEHDRVERQVLLIEPSAIMGLQIRRLFRDAGGETRAVFENFELAARWVAPSLTPDERAAFERFGKVGQAA